MIGPFSMDPLMAVAELAGKLSVSVISPGGNAPALSNKIDYPTFLRTIPSQADQIKASLNLVVHYAGCPRFVVTILFANISRTIACILIIFVAN